jgi:hypothetical protein
MQAQATANILVLSLELQPRDGWFMTLGAHDRRFLTQAPLRGGGYLHIELGPVLRGVGRVVATRGAIPLSKNLIKII